MVDRFEFTEIFANLGLKNTERPQKHYSSPLICGFTFHGFSYLQPTTIQKQMIH